jgi:hypothetical protein
MGTRETDVPLIWSEARSSPLMDNVVSAVQEPCRNDRRTPRITGGQEGRLAAAEDAAFRPRYRSTCTVHTWQSRLNVVKPTSSTSGVR